jgi:hypothetical protein
VKEFVDYDSCTHSLGETFVFRQTNFVPYEDGLSVYVSLLKPDGTPGPETSFRMQWREEEQASIIEHFQDFVRCAD